MRKSLFISALMAMMIASCTSQDEETALNGASPDGTEASQTPLLFDVYAERGTRGGKASDLDLTALQASDGGFGVFAYYTDLKKYDRSYLPNFMYNQQVTYNSTGSNWTYQPVMYWPNEYGTGADSDDEDKVTFFAYAPYAKHTAAASGSIDGATSGIVGFSRNSVAGDPLVKYVASFDPTSVVDLCWGVCKETSWALVENGGTQTMESGLPWLDVQRPQTTGQKMKFTFEHALAQLNVTVKADFQDAPSPGGSTKIYVRSVSFTGIAERGALNLNNTTANQALWLDYGGAGDLAYGQSVTIHDGRRDGREGIAGAVAANETVRGLNNTIISNDGNTQAGVTATAVNLFNSTTESAPVYVIPTGEDMTVTIVYDVETANPKLAGTLSDGKAGVSIENRITKTVGFTGGLQSGKKYTLNLTLGMNSVKFDAAVEGWSSTADDTGEALLPSNDPSGSGGGSGGGSTHKAGDVVYEKVGDFDCAKIYTSETSGFYVVGTDKATSVNWGDAINYTESQDGKTFTCGSKSDWEAVILALGGSGGYFALNANCSSITGWSNMTEGYGFNDFYWSSTTSDNPDIAYSIQKMNITVDNKISHAHVRLIAPFSE